MSLNNREKLIGMSAKKMAALTEEYFLNISRAIMEILPEAPGIPQDKRRTAIFSVIKAFESIREIVDKEDIKILIMTRLMQEEAAGDIPS